MSDTLGKEGQAESRQGEGTLTKKIRIHLTSTQKARLDPAARGENALAVPSPQETTTAEEGAPDNSADPGNSATPSDSEMRGSGSDLTGSATTRPTADVRLF